jgi:protein gp37
MSDLFQEEIDDDWIDQVFAVMWNASWHRYLVLTKRAKRLYQYLTTPNRAERIARTAFQQWCTWEPQKAAEGLLSVKDFLDDVRLPLDHVGIGVSVENQRMAELRLPWLELTPAAKRFASFEPLLGAINLLTREWQSDAKPPTIWLDLAICGGESGPNRRPMQLTWLTSLVEQCQEAGVKVHVKQDGAMKPGQQGRIPDEMWALKAMLWEQGE